MENKEQNTVDKKTSVEITDEETAQASGGHSHARSTVFRARRPGGGLSSCKCEKCGAVLPDAGAYFEHKRMVHGE